MVLDLEDSVPIGLKQQAREMVAETLKSAQLNPKYSFPLSKINLQRVGVRINYGCEEDLVMLTKTPSATHLILPKISRPEEIGKIEGAFSKSPYPSLLVTVETPAGLANLKEISQASQRITGLLVHAQKFT